MSPLRDVALIVFVRAPQLGKVKTRLAAEVGDKAALSIYKRLLDFTRDLVVNTRLPVYVYYADHIPQDDLWSPVAKERRAQSGADLGARMHLALQEVLTSHSSALLIGSDCGQLNSDILSSAIDHLNWTDITVGPSHDGGYYLLGMKTPQSQLFQDVQWSSPAVFATTIERILTGNQNFSILPQLSDVDTLEDWTTLGWS